MLIELWRKVLATDYTNTFCSVCGNDHDRGNVFPVALSDRGDKLGEMCLVCLDYLNRRKDDADDPTFGNWPARDWPSLEDLEEARRLHPDAMFADRGEREAAAPDLDAQDEIYAASVVWRMGRETNSAR
jgi:hypothetical protein